MRKSPVYPKYETGDYGAFEFDPELDFSQFLNEARQHRIDSSFLGSSPKTEPEGGRRKPSECEKSGKKKSWKRYLIFWRKSEKKIEPRAEPVDKSRHKPRKGHTSGPVHVSSTREIPARDATGRRRPFSGPLLGMFGSGKRSGTETPYVALGETRGLRGASPYGPVYLVT